MKIKALAILLLPSVHAEVRCVTLRGPKSMKTVPTTTYTSTTTTGDTTVFRTFMSTGSPYTLTSVVGKTTITIPAGPHFTPLVSAPTSTSTWSSWYVTQVTCDATKTITIGNFTTASYDFILYTYPAVVVTSHVATSTAYAACARTATTSATAAGTDVGFGPNLRRRIHGRLISYTEDKDRRDSYPAASEKGVAILNAATCCEWAQRGNFTGYTYDVSYVGNQFLTLECHAFRDAWSFSNFDFFAGPRWELAPNSTYGNGPGAGGATFVKYVPPAQK